MVVVLKEESTVIALTAKILGVDELIPKER